MQEKRIKAKVFLEGIQIPFNTVTVNASLHAPPTCSIRVAPHPSLIKILPKTTVHVFTIEPNAYNLYDEEDVSNWKLLFEGEVTGRGYSRTATSNNFEIQAKGMGSYYHDTKLSQANELSFIVNVDQAYIDELSGVKFKKYKTFNKWNSIFAETTKPDEHIIETVLRNLYAIIQNYVYLKDRAEKFYLADERRIKAKIEDETLRTLFNSKSLLKMLPEMNLQTQRDTIVNFLNDFLSNFYFRICYDYNSLTLLRIVPDLYFNPPPSCNVIFPNQIISLNTNRNFEIEPTRTVARTKNEVLDQATGFMHKNSYIAPNTDFIFNDINLKEITKAMGETLNQKDFLTKVSSQIQVLEKAQVEGNARLEKLKKEGEDLKAGASKEKKEIIDAKKADNKNKTDNLTEKIDRLTEQIQKFKKYGNDIQQGQINYELFSFLFKNDLSPIERLKGPNAVFIDLPEIMTRDFLDKRGIKEIDKNLNAEYIYDNKGKRTLFSTFAEYQHIVQNFYNRQLSATLTFDNNLTPGFPTLIMDQVEPIYAFLNNVTHIISASGTASSNISANFVRFISETDGMSDRFSQMGGYLEAAGVYFPPFINETVYKEKLTETYDTYFNNYLPAKENKYLNELKENIKKNIKKLDSLLKNIAAYNQNTVLTYGVGGPDMFLDRVTPLLYEAYYLGGWDAVKPFYNDELRKHWFYNFENRYGVSYKFNIGKIKTDINLINRLTKKEKTNVFSLNDEAFISEIIIGNTNTFTEYKNEWEERIKKIRKDWDKIIKNSDFFYYDGGRATALAFLDYWNSLATSDDKNNWIKKFKKKHIPSFKFLIDFYSYNIQYQHKKFGALFTLEEQKKYGLDMFKDMPIFQDPILNILINNPPKITNVLNKNLLDYIDKMLIMENNPKATPVLFNDKSVLVLFQTYGYGLLNYLLSYKIYIEGLDDPGPENIELIKNNSGYLTSYLSTVIRELESSKNRIPGQKYKDTVERIIKRLHKYDEQITICINKNNIEKDIINNMIIDFKTLYYIFNQETSPKQEAVLNYVRSLSNDFFIGVR